MNKVILMGRIARDVDTRTTQSGKTVSRMTLAVDRRISKNAQPGQPTADFLNLVAWGKLAEFCQNYLRKGTKILVEGHLQSRSYEAQDGSKRYVTEVNVADIEFAESKGNSQSMSNSNEQAINSNVPMQGTLGQRVNDDDIPF